jgi:Ca2+-binding EF-hand superfamily protein
LTHSFPHLLSSSFQRAQFEIESYVDDVVNKVIQEVGNPQSGTIQAKDLINYALNNPSFLKTSKPAEIEELFCLYDVDTNGILDASELKSMITSQNIGAKINSL